MASNSLVQYVHEHVLECALCTEPFKSPKSLPCLHVFCEDCIESYIEKNLRQGSYACPICQEVHQLPDNGIDSLRNAFLKNHFWKQQI